MRDIAMRSMEEVSGLLESGKLSPVELLDACLGRIRRFQPELNAFVCVTEEEARVQAKRAEQEIQEGHYRGKLHGIPVALKDLYYTKGIRTTGSSEVLRQFEPSFNGTVVQRLLDAGAVVIGKTNTHEFAFGPTTEESCFGPTRNPWNPKKIPGGSSGGSGAAAATGMAYVALGTDTGGSIRIPASMCGVVGFKPSIGLVSLHGILALSFSLDHPGPICRSVADAAITMDAITGTDPQDPCTFAVKGNSTHFYGELAGVTDLRGRVIGIPENFFFDKTDYEVETIFYEAAKRLEELGAELRRVKIPALELVTDASTCLMFSEAAYIHRDWYPSLREKYQAGVAERLDQGNGYSAVQYIQSLKDREVLMDAWEKVMEEYDAIIAPTCPIAAFDIGLGSPWPVVTRGKTEPGKPMCTYHTRLADMTGAPALSLPAGLTKEGLPVGLMIMGRRGGDGEVLKMGYAYEKHYSYPVFCDAE